MFGGRPLEDLDIFQRADDVVASAKKNFAKPSTSCPLFGSSEQEAEHKQFRVRLRKMGDVVFLLEFC